MATKKTAKKTAKKVVVAERINQGTMPFVREFLTNNPDATNADLLKTMAKKKFDLSKMASVNVTIAIVRKALGLQLREYHRKDAKPAKKVAKKKTAAKKVSKREAVAV